MESDISSDSDLKKALPGQSPFNFSRISQVIFQPAKAFTDILEKPYANGWQAPVVTICVIIIILSLLSTLGVTTTTRAATSTGTSSSSTAGTSTTQSGSFAGGSFAGGGFPGGGGSSLSLLGNLGRSSSSSTTTVSLSPATNAALTSVRSLIGFLLTWLILGALANLLVVAVGGQGNAKNSLILAGWACIPLGVRYLMRIIYVIATGTAISHTGLSGFITSTSTTVNALLSGFLGQIDIYLIWAVILLIIGITLMSGLTRQKSTVAVILSVIILMVLSTFLNFGIDKLVTAGSSFLSKL